MSRMKTAVILKRTYTSKLSWNYIKEAIDEPNYTQDFNIEVLETFIDSSWHTAGLNDRDKLLECLTYCKIKRPDVLIIKDISCLGNNSTDIIEVIRQLTSVGVSVQILNLDLQTIPDNIPGKECQEYIDSVVIPLLEAITKVDSDRISSRLQEGRNQYKANGGHLGRPKGTGKTADILAKEYPGIVKLLQDGKLTLSEIARLEGKSESTVKKVKKFVTVMPDIRSAGKHDLMWERLESNQNSDSFEDSEI